MICVGCWIVGVWLNCDRMCWILLMALSILTFPFCFFNFVSFKTGSCSIHCHHLTHHLTLSLFSCFSTFLEF
jgi:hypothetical protein